MPETPWNKLISPEYGKYIHESCKSEYQKAKAEVGNFLSGVLKLAQDEREASEPYKDLFERTGGKPFPVQLFEVYHDMMGVVLNYHRILEAHGYKVDNEGWKLLYSIPLLVSSLKADIIKQDGWPCSTDKVFHILHRELLKHIKKEE